MITPEWKHTVRSFHPIITPEWLIGSKMKGKMLFYAMTQSVINRFHKMNTSRTFCCEVRMVGEPRFRTGQVKVWAKDDSDLLHSESVLGMWVFVCVLVSGGTERRVIRNLNLCSTFILFLVKQPGLAVKDGFFLSPPTPHHHSQASFHFVQSDCSYFYTCCTSIHVHSECPSGAELGGKKYAKLFCAQWRE